VNRALNGVTVLALEQATTLPFLTYRLVCDGARVIRVENPQRPDPNRFVGRDVLGEPGMHAYFLPNNCGKEAITLNLGTAEGRALLHELVARLPVDIVATNQRPRSYAALGIDEPTLRGVRRDLIWVAISGFGPDHDEPAYDPVLQARAGFMALTGEPEGAPTPFGVPMVDLGAAEHAYGEVMKALYRRAKTGEGARIDVAMFRSAVSWLVAPVAVESLGERVSRRGSGHQFFAPVGVHATRDGHVYLAVGNDAQWKALAALPALAGIDRPEYAANAGRIADAAHLHAALGERLGRLTTDEALALVRGAEVPVARVATMPEVLTDPLVAPHLARVRDPRTGVSIALPPPPTGDAPALTFPPRLGEHNARVYGALGLTAAQLGRLQSLGVI
jgi:crotonobetainyl-CoA:carnitine CoA-transferase CaiB-like acyl-CoA transferase